MNRGFHYNREKIEEILLIKTQKWNNIQKRIHIKKLAYQGNSKWQVQDMDGYNYQAKILDISWLTNFQNGTLIQENYPAPKAILLVEGDIEIKQNNEGFEKYTFDIYKIISVENPVYPPKQSRLEYYNDE